MLIATENVIRRAEAIYRDFEVAKLQAYQARPGNPNRIEFASFAGVTATLGPYVGYFNRLYGLTKDQVPMLSEVIRFYERTRTDFELTVSPLDASLEVGRALIDCGFRPGEYHGKFFLDLTEPRLSAERAEEVTVSPVGSGQVDVFLEVMLEGWGMAREHWDGAKENMRLRFGIAGATLFWGSLEGAAIGGAILYVSDEDAYLADAATRPSARRKGCQLALIRARIAKAQSLGCKRLFGCAPFGSSSAHNMQRAGLKLASSDMTWHYRFPQR